MNIPRLKTVGTIAAQDTKPAKKRLCAVKTCRKSFQPWNTLQRVCGPSCGAEWAKQEREKKERKDAIQKAKLLSQENREHRGKLIASRKISWHLDRAQKAFNAYIRARDYGNPCICCGDPIDWNDKLSVNAGHWRTVAAAGHLRFNEDNVHAQKARCNLYGAGNQAAMEQGMIRKIGLERVEALRNSNKTHNWTREELTDIWEIYKAKLKKLKKEQP